MHSCTMGQCISPVMLQSVMARACRWDRGLHSAGKVPFRCVLDKVRLGKLAGPAHAAGRLSVTETLPKDSFIRAGKAPSAPHAGGKVPASAVCCVNVANLRAAGPQHVGCTTCAHSVVCSDSGIAWHCWTYRFVSAWGNASMNVSLVGCNR